MVRFEIDRDFGTQEGNDHTHCNANLEYKKLADQQPYLCGSFTGWRYIKMQSLEDFNRKHDKNIKTPFELALLEDKIRNTRKSIEDCNIWEKRWVEIMETR